MRPHLAAAVLVLAAPAAAQSPRVLVLAEPSATAAIGRELAPLIDVTPVRGIADLSAEPRPDGLIVDTSLVSEDDRAAIGTFVAGGGSVMWFGAAAAPSSTDGWTVVLPADPLDETTPAFAWASESGSGRRVTTVLHDLEDPDGRRQLGEIARWLFDPHTRRAPTGALRLADDPAHWVDARTGEPHPWRWSEGVLEVVPGQGSIRTTEAFGDMRLHVEFRIPTGEDGKPPAQGNSGVYIQQRYEVQILDSHGGAPEPKGCGSLYGQRAADVNASRRAGEWQSYDVWFRAPRWNETGSRVERARITVVHNHAVIHRDVALSGKTGAGQPEAPTDAPLLLQDHGAAVQFRNVWLLRQ